ncbi:hypothetical protein Pelo_12662 [Pelomyxa schiedti]|nr:hypothetical protein Pelo_12662 [Pelomyxa schiedti]
MEGTVVVSGDGYSNVDPASNATGLSFQTDEIPTHHVAILPGDPVSTVGTEATEHEEVTGLTTGTGPTGDTVAPMDMSAGGEGGRNTVELVDSTAEEMCSCCFTTKKLVVITCRMKLTTTGLLGVGWIVDGIRMYWLVKQVNEQLQLTEVPVSEPAIVPVDDQMLAEAGHKFESFMCPISRSWRMDYMDTYILWFPLGWLGLHQLYMRNYVRFLALFLSLGGWFVVWILDGFLIPWQMKISRTSRTSTQKSLYTAYLAWIPFGGWLGLHHYYLGNYCRGVLYMFTLGLFGIGWLYDGFAMYWHIKKANRRAAPAPIPAAAPPIEPPGPTIVVGM